MTYQEILYRIVWEAQRGGEKFEIAQQDALSTAEAIFPTVTDSVSKKVAGDSRTRKLLQRTKTITMNDGEGAIPDDVLVRYVESDATLLNPTDTSKIYAYKPFNEFIKTLNPLLGYFTVIGELRLLQREPGALYVPGQGFSDDMELTTPCQIVRPTALDEELDIVSELNAEVIKTGAEMLRGAIVSRAVAA